MRITKFTGFKCEIQLRKYRIILRWFVKLMNHQFATQQFNLLQVVMLMQVGYHRTIQIQHQQSCELWKLNTWFLELNKLCQSYQQQELGTTHLHFLVDGFGNSQILLQQCLDAFLIVHLTLCESPKLLKSSES